MKLKSRIIVPALAALLAVAGCNPAANISVVEAAMPTLNGVASLHGKAVIENGGAQSLTVENATLTVKYRDRELTRARLMLPIAIPARQTTSVRYDMALDGLSPGGLQTLASRMLTNPEAVTVDVEGWIRVGAVRKKIEIKEMEAARLIDNLF
jgi:LEA14-like dessication related protein